jgi:hypothetical protein
MSYYDPGSPSFFTGRDLVAVLIIYAILIILAVVSR